MAKKDAVTTEATDAGPPGTGDIAIERSGEIVETPSEADPQYAAVPPELQG